MAHNNSDPLVSTIIPAYDQGRCRLAQLNAHQPGYTKPDTIQQIHQEARKMIEEKRPLPATIERLEEGLVLSLSNTK